MDFDDPFSLDFDDLRPIAATKKRKNVIGLDDLLKDHKKEQEINRKKKSKAAKKYWDSDDEAANETETKLTETLHNFKRTIEEVDGQEVASIENLKKDMTLSWGLELFGAQSTPTQLAIPELGNSLLSQKYMNDKISVLMDACSPMGEMFLRGLLLNGWLSKLIISLGHLDESVAKWTVNLMLHSSEKSLMTSACDFWCTILLSDKIQAAVIKIEWLPGFAELNRALESFGFQLHPPTNVLADEGTSNGNSDCKGPPANMRAWIKFTSAYCQVRSKFNVLSTLEAQEFAATVVCLFLERKLLGLSSGLHDCFLSAINMFEQNEWGSSCGNVSKFVADRVPKDLNCLRVVECVLGIDARSKQLRSALASQILKSCFLEMSNAKDILKFLLSKNLKDKSCDLFKIYIYFVLAENWILYHAELEPDVNDLWKHIIRKCSTQISNTDFRSCAQELRNRASYLQQSTSNKQQVMVIAEQIYAADALTNYGNCKLCCPRAFS